MSTKPPEHSRESIALTPDLLERLRQTGIRLDRAGRLWHEGAEITHRGFRRAILRWLDRRDDGRAIIRLDAQRYAYIDVEDADLLVLSARWDGDRIMVRLNDESEQELEYTSLKIGADDALYCTVRSGRLRARITTTAYYVIAEGIAEADCDQIGTVPDPSAGGEAEESFVLRAAGRVFALRQRQG